MTSESPWSGLEMPSQVGEVTSRRVDPDGRWDFFWARDWQRRYVLLLRVSRLSLDDVPLPKLKSIEITSASKNGKGFLLFALRDVAHLDPFTRLCRDIVEATGGAASEAEAVTSALERTWRWHHLLRGGTDGRLSRDEQMGLIAELRFLEDLLMIMPGRRTVGAWRGPFEAPKDFELGRVCVEVKARRGGAGPRVSISSLEQLDEEGLEALFLRVMSLDRALDPGQVGVTLSDVVARVRATVTSVAPDAVLDLDRALTAVGFNDDHSYADFRWLEGPIESFHVTNDFPRIKAAEVRTGVDRITYAIDLRVCETHIVDDGMIWTAIGLGRDER